ncbi:MAG TPA: ATP-dependent RecD-like DNA helicase, partial [Candidatus Binatia bacterium]
MEKSTEKSALQGTVSRITYQHRETHYTVARLESDNGTLVTVVGPLFPVSEGEEIKVFGSWKNHPRYGLQFQIDHWQKVEPATIEGIEKYLGSGLIRGIGPSYAKRLVQCFGLDTLRILSEEPLRILEVEGIGEVRARRIMHAWQEQRCMQDVMVFLQGHGVGPALALRIYRALGSATTSRVKENPYCLAREVRGIGFLLADRIANAIGIRGDFPLRIQAGVLHVLRESADRGHCFLGETALKKNAGALLGVDYEAIEIALEKLALDAEIISPPGNGETENRIYLTDLYYAERRVASAIQTLLSSSSFLHGERVGKTNGKSPAVTRGSIDFRATDLLGALPIHLDQDQIEAAMQALERKVFVITGGPGTGKTTLLKSLLTILRRSQVTFALAAPTGRAAKRMNESTGEDAMTIHRLLEYNPREGAFQRDADSPLEIDVVVVDEASMIDVTLMDHLLNAIQPHSHLILVGDVDQLPSVGPGSVLKDLIESGVVPVARLRRIFRQDEQSYIVVNAHRILGGENPVFSGPREQRDFDFVPGENEIEILEKMKALLREQIPRKLGISPEEAPYAVQVLTPMHRGMLGTIQLNRELQNLFNPGGPALERGGLSFRVKDKVMQLRNNYEKGVFNGDLGKVVTIDRDDGKVCVTFDDKRVEYETDELDEITLAYATSIHKSQGSEYPAVVIPLHLSHYVMLYRSILYTAVTRGKTIVTLIGSPRAL